MVKEKVSGDERSSARDWVASRPGVAMIAVGGGVLRAAARLPSGLFCLPLVELH